MIVLGPPEGARSLYSPDTRFAQIRAVIEQRLDLVPRLRKRAVGMPLGLQRAVWVDDIHLDADAHVRRAALPAPGGRRELDALVGQVMSRPLDTSRPLWEMVVVEGLAGDRMAVVARLHHAILDGVSGAAAMAAFLDLGPRPRSRPAPGNGTARPPRSAHPASTAPSALSMWRYAVGAICHQPEAVVGALNRGLGAMVELTKQNRSLADRSMSPPPALFSAPRTSLNGSVTGERRFASLAVPLEDLELVRVALGPRSEADSAGPRSGDTSTGATVNDVILCAVGGALARLLEKRGERPTRPLVALIPVSTRGRAVPPPGGVADVGNYVSGMLASLASTVADPVARLAAVARGTRIAKQQEARAGGDLLEGMTRAVPPALVSTAIRGIGALRLFDRFPPPFNVVVSSVVVPDVSLWWAGCPVVDLYPAAPVADGVGLNVTSMTYKGVVHFGLLACPRLVPDLDDVVLLLDDEIGELVSVALDAQHGLGPRHRSCT